MMNNQHYTHRILIKKMFDGTDYYSDIVMVIKDGLIVALETKETEYEEVLDGLVVPGFVDLQVNGGGGVLFNSSPSPAALSDIFSAHAKYGTTAMMPTIITDQVDVMKAAANAVSVAIKDTMLGIIGIHFEGPHISVAKKGAHSEQFVRPICEEEWRIFERNDIGLKMVTLAPESVSTKDIKRFKSAGVVVSIGHSDATCQHTQQAIDAGADGFTHLFNAMSGLRAREAGVIGAALLNDNAKCGLIVDGHHVSKDSCKLALKVKPVGGIFLVTDAMPPVGTDITEFNFFNRKVHLNNGKLTSSTGELAGSVLDMATAVKKTIAWLNVSESEAIRMATLYPLQFLANATSSHVEARLLAPSRKANFVQLDVNYNLVSTWLAGRCVHKSKVSQS